MCALSPSACSTASLAAVRRDEAAGDDRLRAAAAAQAHHTDEPSTALDVITQDYIFTILQQIHEEMKISMLLLTHDIAVVAKVAQRVCVMYAGNIIEYGDVFSIFDDPKHEYTRV